MLAIADLEGDSHFVVLVECLMKAFALVRLKLDIVSGSNAEQAAYRGKSTKIGQEHLEIGAGGEGPGGNCG